MRNVIKSIKWFFKPKKPLTIVDKWESLLKYHSPHVPTLSIEDYEKVAQLLEKAEDIIIKNHLNNIQARDFLYQIRSGWDKKSLNLADRQYIDRVASLRDKDIHLQDNKVESFLGGYMDELYDRDEDMVDDIDEEYDLEDISLEDYYAAAKVALENAYDK